MRLKGLLAGTAFASFLGVIFATFPASAYTILPPGSTVAGKPIADWTAAWWTWIAQSPDSKNPIYDPTGAWANQNNGGPVFFVAGTGGGPANRTFKVPAGKPVLFPLISTTWIGWPPDTEEVVNNALAGWAGTVDLSSLFASIDGQVVPNLDARFEQSDFFSAGTAVAGTVATGSFFGGAPVGADLSPSRSVGYWVLVDGLSPGPHTLNFGGAFKDGSLVTDTTANINVTVPEPATLLLVGAGLWGLRTARRHLLPFA